MSISDTGWCSIELLYICYFIVILLFCVCLGMGWKQRETWKTVKMTKFIMYNFILCEYNQKFVYDRIFNGSPRSIAGIATYSGLDGWEFELWWGQDFLCLSRPAPRCTQPPVKWGSCCFPEDEAARAWDWPPTTFSTQAKQRVELYLYFSSGHSWACYRDGLTYYWNFDTISVITYFLNVKHRRERYVHIPNGKW